MDLDKTEIRKNLQELEQAREDVILAQYRLEEAMDSFDDLFGPGTARKAVRLLRSKELARKLILTKESLNSIENEIYDELLKEEEE